MTEDEIKEAVNSLFKLSQELDKEFNRPPLVLTDAQIKMFSEAGFLEGIDYINIKDFKFNP